MSYQAQQPPSLECHHHDRHPPTMSGFYSFAESCSGLSLSLALDCISTVTVAWLTKFQDMTSWSITEEICRALERRIGGLGLEFHEPDLKGTSSCSFHSIGWNSAIGLCPPGVPRTLAATLLFFLIAGLPSHTLCCKPHPGSSGLWFSIFRSDVLFPKPSICISSSGWDLSHCRMRYNLIPPTKPDFPSLARDLGNSSFCQVPNL